MISQLDIIGIACLVAAFIWLLLETRYLQVYLMEKIIIVSASDASPVVKSHSNYVCLGKDDQNVIQKAIDNING
jgi:hypothetical protein